MIVAAILRDLAQAALEMGKREAVSAPSGREELEVEKWKREFQRMGLDVPDAASILHKELARFERQLSLLISRDAEGSIVDVLEDLVRSVRSW